ncbi:MAG: SRPBCC family protein [Phycisphaeraceae bacterium]|nr:MAG: SRPBCC family protein [Phycisphaeraceae bacterium]
MATITLVEDIGAPAAAVRRLALDIEGTPKLFPQITKVEMLASPKDGEGLAGVGTRWRETRRVGLGSATVELEVTGRDADGSFVVSCGAMGARVDTRFAFTPLGAGRCRVTLGVTITPGGWWSRVMSGVMKWAMAKGLREDLASLKRAAEAGAG